VTDYTKSTNFATKDSLPPGSALKIVRGTEIDTEFNSIATAVATKANSTSPTLSGGTIDNAVIGGTIAAAGTFTALTSTGNTLLGDAATDTLNVGAGGLVKDASGNVGVGTTTPSSVLELKAATPIQTFNQTTANSNQGVQFKVSGAAYGQILNNSTTGIMDIRNGLSAGAGYVVTFSTDGSERARIDSSGNLLVGNTTFSSAVKVLRLSQGNWSNSAGTSSTYEHANFLNTNGQVGTISTSGTSTSYNTSSDYRLKEDIAPMTSALAKVSLLKPVTYKWKVDGSDGQGFIAHELAEVEANCVNGAKDAVDAEGNPVYQGIDTSFLVATLTAAIQELKAIVDTLDARCTTQAQRITALENANK
jgi:hypothetical protein